MNKTDRILFLDQVDDSKLKEKNNRSRISKNLLLPDEIISSKELLIEDDNLVWNVKHQLRKTAKKQAGHLVQVYRQSELDQARVEQAMRLRFRAVMAAAEWLDLCYQLGESYARSRPDLAKRVWAMVEESADDLGQLPRAGMILFLRRYSLG